MAKVRKFKKSRGRRFRKRSGVQRRIRKAYKSRGNTTVWKSRMLASKFHMKMPYHSYNILNGTESQQIIMAGNSVFDPYMSGGGRQPAHYDDLALMYQEYYVVASKCSVTFINQSAEVARVYLIPQNGNTTYAYDENSTAQADDQQWAKTATLAPGTNGSHNSATLSYYMTTNRISGLSTQDNPNYAAGTSSDPATLWTWQFGAYDFSPASVPLNIHCEVNMTYYVEWRRQLRAQETD